MVALVAPLLALVAPVPGATAANNVGVPAGSPPAGYAKLIVKKGGDRTASATVGPLAGATFQFYRVGSGSSLSDGALMPDTCTTDATGQCGVFAPLGSGDSYFYGVETSAPAGWSIADTWGTSTQYFRYNSGRVRASDSNRVKTLPAESSSTWPNVRDNPPAPEQCGLDIRMIFDVSTSVDNTELDQFKAAGRGVIDALASTPSRVSLSRFSSNAADVLSLTPVSDAGGVSTVKNAIDGISQGNLGQYTNWDRALWGSADSGEDYDVALVLTDGDPTTSSQSGTSASTKMRDIEEAIHSANALKAKGTHVIAVGIGMSGTASVSRLNQISSVDATYTTDWNALAAELRRIATGLCNNAVTVQKKVLDWQGNEVPNSPLANGWQFTGSIAGGSTIGSFPVTAPVNGQNGFATAEVSIPAGATPTVTITENLQAGYTLEGATCTVDGANAPVNRQGNAFSFTGKANSVMACVFTNKQAPPQPKLTLKKQVYDAAGQLRPASAGEAWTLTASGADGFSGAGNTAAVTDKPVQAGTTYTLSESAVAGYANGTAWQCVLDAGPGTLAFTGPDKVTPKAGQQITCTIANRRTMADLTVSKTATPSYDRDYDWSITKDVEQDKVNTPEGTPVEVDYTVTVTPSAPKDTGFKVSGTITITNPNPEAVSGVTVTDTLTGGNCTVGAFNGTVPGNGTATVDYTCAMPAGTPTTSGTNTVRVTWDKAAYNGTTGVATGSRAFNFANAQVRVTDATATVTDTAAGPNAPGAPGGVVVNAVDGPRTFPYTRTINGVVGKCTTHDNTATVTPADHPGQAQEADADVEVCVGGDLSIDKIATITYDRAYKWKVTKSGPGHVFVGDGGAVVNYNVKVETDGYDDSAWGFGGTIFVSNPNAWDVPVTITDTPTIAGQSGVTCTLTDGANQTVAANANRQAFAYSCSGLVQGNYSGTNTASIEWDQARFFTPSDSDEHSVAITVTDDAEPLNETVNVSDVFNGGDPEQLNTTPLNWHTVKDTPAEFPYSARLTAGPGACVTYTNVAQIGATDASSTVTTEACRPAVSKTVDASYGKRQTWTLTKDVDRTQAVVGPNGNASFDYTVVATPGAVVDLDDATWSGRIQVSNPSTSQAFAYTVSDTPAVGDWTCELLGDATGTVDPGGTVNVTYDCSGTGHPSGNNTATVSFGNQSVSTTVPVAFSATATLGTTATLTDDISGDGMPALEFPVDASKGANTFNYSRSLGAPIGACQTWNNTAVLELTGPDLEAKKAVGVCSEAPLAIAEVDVAGDFDRAYSWSIEKSVDKTHVEVDQATGEATFDYDVTVKAGAKRDSGFEMTGTVKVTNPTTFAGGAITLTGGSLTTDLGGGATCTYDDPVAGTVVPANGSVTLGFTCTFTGAPASSGSVDANVTWDPAGPATSRTAEGSGAAAFTIDTETNKTVDVVDDKTNPATAVTLKEDLVWSEGLEETYSYSLTHQGKPGECVAFTNTAIVDQPTGADPKDSTTATVCVEKPVAVDVAAAGSYDLAYPWSIDKVVDPQGTVEVDAATGEAEFTYTVTVRAGAAQDSGYQLTGKVTVDNPNSYAGGAIELTGGSLDTDLAGATCTFDDDVAGTNIAPDGSATLDFTCLFAGQPGTTGSIDADVTWDPAGPGTSTSAGDSTDVSLAVGTETNKVVDVIDDKTDPDNPVVLEEDLAWSRGLVKTYTYKLTHQGKPGECVAFTNTAMVDLPSGDDPTAQTTARVCTERPAVVSKVDVAGDFDRSYPWSIEKSVDKTRVEVDAATGASRFDYTVQVKAGAAKDSGWQMAGTVTVRNPNTYDAGAIALTGGSLSTDLGGGATCTYDDPVAGTVVGVNGSATLDFTCTFTSAPSASGSVNAGVTWDPAGPANSATAEGSGDAAFTIDTETNKVVDVVDDKTNPASPVVLEKGLTWSQGLVKNYTYSLTHQGKPGECVAFTNTAKVDLPTGTDPTDSTMVNVCAEAPLTMAATVAGDLARSYAWSIDKSVDATERNVDDSGTATFTYTVVARAGAATDSGWKVGGTVSLTNPNGYDGGAIEADVAATTDLGGGAVCTVAGGQDVAVAAGATVTLPVTCTFASAPKGSGQVVLTATWDPAGPAASANATATRDVTLGVRTETNKVVDIVDDKTVPGQRHVLEQGVVWAPGLVKTYTYTLALAGGAEGSTVPYTNTATVDVPEGPDPTDTESVSVLTPEVAPAEAFGKAVGRVRANCFGTVRTKLNNKSGERVVYRLKIGKKVYKVSVPSLRKKTVVRKGPFRARVVLRASGRTLDRVRIPARCAPPEVLPETGLRAGVVARTAAIQDRRY